MKHIFISLILTTAFLAQEVKALPPWIKVNEKGSLKIKDIQGELVHFNKNWKRSTQKEGNFQVIKDKENQAFKAEWNLDKIIEVSETLKAINNNAISYETLFTAKEDIPTNTLCLSLNLPVNSFAGRTILFNDNKISLPVSYEKMILFSNKNIHKLSFVVDSKKLTIEGNWDVLLQDNRKFNTETYSIRLMCSPSRGNIRNSSLKAKISLETFPSQAISIKKNANMGFRDETGEDKKGGWTDQGPENDLRMLKTGKQVLGGVTFDILSPYVNNGKSCMVFSSHKRNYSLDSAIIVPETKYNGYLYLLHALAWAPKDKIKVASINVEYEDGNRQIINISNNIDVGNWWEPYPLKEGTVAWTGENPKSYVGLYLSKFKLQNKPIAKLTLTTEKNAVWMVAGVSISDKNIPVKASSKPPYYIVEGKNWKSINPDMNIAKDSVMDFSFLLEAPAGKYGKVIIKDGHFAFEQCPEKNVRFYGNNLCFEAQYLEKADCEKLAEQFARQGYNAVRFHHYDNPLVDKDSKSSTVLDKERLDKLDYLFYCFKKNGVYITTDLYCSRRFKAGEINGFGKLTHYEMKALLPINEQAFDNWKMFSKGLLSHKNPYTDMTWGEDPSLFGISLINEDTLFAQWDRYPKIKNEYLNKFNEWLKINKITCKGEEEKAASFALFIVEKQKKAIKKMRDYLEKELKVTALVSDVNFYSGILQSFIRQDLDYVDNHAYWDHPRFIEKKWRMPFKYSNTSVLEKMAYVPRRIMASRIIGKPFMATEFNYCYPNKFRAEGGPVMGAYAALQGWNGLFRFTYSNGKSGRIFAFNTVDDPISFLSEKIGILLFLRGDAKTSKLTAPYVYSQEDYSRIKVLGGKDLSFPEKYQLLGLHMKIGSLNIEQATIGKGYKTILSEIRPQNVPKGLSWKKIDQNISEIEIASKKINLNSDTATSSTEEIFLNKKNLNFKVTTPKTEVIELQEQQELNGKFLSIKNKQGFSVICATSMDNKPLASSKRMLIFHLTDVQNNKIKFASNKQHIVLKWGQKPLLLRRGQAEIKINKKYSKNAKAWAIGISGKRKSEVQLKNIEEKIGLDADTFSNNGTFIYEIILDE